MKNSAGRGGCYPPRPKAEVDNILRDLQNSSYSAKAEFNNCFIIHSLIHSSRDHALEPTNDQFPTSVVS